mmetsp:Transcript_9750/g.31921  ORF Transcript_9750/g.31921 Transcript_9750/m.31921 type:complete len:202 (-) Transcript_9750:1751-2356(-)
MNSSAERRSPKCATTSLSCSRDSSEETTKTATMPQPFRSASFRSRVSRMRDSAWHRPKSAWSDSPSSLSSESTPSTRSHRSSRPIIASTTNRGSTASAGRPPCPPPGKHAAREGTEPHTSPSPLHAASPAASPPAASRMPPSCSRESRTRSFAAAETPDSTALLSPGSLSGGSGGATDADAAPARRGRKDIGASVGRSERP